MAESARSEASGKEGKRWFRIAKSMAIYQVVMEFGKDNGCKYPIKADAAANIPRKAGGRRTTWEPDLYKLIGSSRYKVIVEYDNMKYVELKIRNKGKNYELVGCKSVDYPEEFSTDAGGGFDAGGGLKGFGGTKDGIMKSLGAFSSSNAVKLGKVKYKPKIKTKAPKKLASGHNLYTAMGTQEIKMREYDGKSKAQMDGEFKDLVPAAATAALSKSWGLLEKTIGERDDEQEGSPPTGNISADKIMDIFTHAKVALTDIQTKRLMEFARLDADEFIQLNVLLDLYNRVLNEQEQGHFHMTVKELQDLFNLHDKDYSGKLEASEISEILGKVHLMTDVNEVKATMEKMDKDGDMAMDFEEFMSLCQLLYKERGGMVVANGGAGAAFNQTRGIITDIRDKVERHHLMIMHLKAQLANFDEQLEVMNTISQHSALQKELNKTKEEKKRLAALRDEMEMQNKSWMRDIKGIHARETRDCKEKITFVEQQQKEAQEALQFTKEAYEEDYTDAMAEVGEILQSLGAVLDFCSKTVDNVQEDERQMQGHKASAVDRMKKYREGRKGTVYSADVYDSATAITQFLQNKTSALEKWLISRTKFTQQDREKYLKRVEKVKKQREEYEANKVELTKQLGTIEKQIKAADKKARSETQINVDLRDKLDDPTSRKHDEKLAKELANSVTSIQKAIADGHAERLEWSKKLYPIEHKLAMERHAISLLQVELGELKIVLEDVHHHPDVLNLSKQKTELEEKKAKSYAKNRGA